MHVIPLFKSHYSLRSILTLEEAGETVKQATKEKRNPALAPDSILDICIDNKITDVFLAEDGMSAFLEAYFNCKKANLSLHYGLRVTVTGNITEKSEESRRTDSKVVIFARNAEGYKRLIQISTCAATEGFYYEPRIDAPSLERFWSPDLLYCIPFYDSFIYYNTLSFRSIVPAFPADPIIFIEDNGLPFDESIKKAIDLFDAKGQFERVLTKSIYYKQRADFTAFQTYKCIRNRSTLNKPQLDHFASDEFCFEAYLEQVNALS